MTSKEGPVLTVDALIEDDKGRILLIKRGVTPFKGKWCLPGGKVDKGERVEAALEREIIEEIGVRIGIREIVGVYSSPDRDPRGHYVTIVYHATIIGGEPTKTKEATDVRWIDRNSEDIELGFDHELIVRARWQKGSKELKANGSGEKRMRSHPVDPLVEQVEDESIEGKRLVEDEAGRGKRAVKVGGGAGASESKAKPMSGIGTKQTVAAGRSATNGKKLKH